MNMNLNEFSLDCFSLKGKTALVTGGNAGLGRAFSMALAKAGANLYIPSIRESESGFDDQIRSTGSELKIQILDLTGEGAPKEAIEGCHRLFGSVDILVNNAGICLVDDVENFGRSQWDKMVQVNLTTAFEMAYEASKVMIPQQSGKIINICSLFSYLGGVGSPAYAATKHGLAGFTKAYCDELAPHNIQVNGIAPGYYATELTAATRENPESNKRIVDHTPAGRWGDPAELMGACVFLASRASNFVNGHLLVVDGGYRVR
jgi:NAD(P)-dependent dehydrogenase (short-subunit alcohol dehydrogenase family)